MAKRILSIAVPLIVALCALWALLPEDPNAVRSERSHDSRQREAGAPRLVGIPPLQQDPGDTGVDAKPARPPVEAAPDTSIQQAAVAKGVVLNADTGEAVVGAAVFFAAAGERFTDVNAVQKTDAEGGFEIGVPNDQDGVVHAVKAGLVPWCEVRPYSGSRDLLVRLHPGESIRGRVVNEIGEPVERVELYAYDPELGGSWPRAPRFRSRHPQNGSSTYSGGDGLFLLQGLLESTQYVVRARKGGWLSRGIARGVRTGGPDLEIVMQRLFRWRIVVKDAHTGSPVRGATVKQMILPPGLRGVAGRREAFDWDLTGLPPGMTVPSLRDYGGSDQLDEAATVRFLISAPGYQKRVFDLPVSREGIHTTDVALEPLPSEVGTVRFRAHFENGLPYEGDLLLRMDFGTQVVPFLDGTATHSVSLPVGRQGIWCAGSRPVGWWWERPSESLSILVADQGTHGQEMELPLLGGIVTLVVQDSSGTELPHFNLDIWKGSHGKGWFAGWRQAFTGAMSKLEGRVHPTIREPYVILNRGAYRIRIVVPGVGSAEEQVVVEGCGVTQTVDLIVQEGVWIDRD